MHLLERTKAMVEAEGLIINTLEIKSGVIRASEEFENRKIKLYPVRPIIQKGLSNVTDE